MYTHMHIHIYIYISICVSVSESSELSEFPEVLEASWRRAPRGQEPGQFAAPLKVLEKQGGRLLVDYRV